jgi:hypothetical protein
MEKLINFDEISIEGCVDIRENPVTVNEFADRFIIWIESNNWYFGGGIKEYKNEGDI